MSTTDQRLRFIASVGFLPAWVSCLALAFTAGCGGDTMRFNSDPRASDDVGPAVPCDAQVTCTGGPRHDAASRPGDGPRAMACDAEACVDAPFDDASASDLGDGPRPAPSCDREATAAWAVKAGGPNGADGANGMVWVDNGLFIAGFYSPPSTFGPGEDGQTVLDELGNPADHFHAFLARYNADGTLCFARALGLFWPNELAVTPSGTLLMAGGFWEEATFGAGEPAETRLAGKARNNGYLAEYAPDGRLIFVRHIVDGSGVGPLALGPEGDALVVSGLGGSDVTLAPGMPGETTFPTSGNWDILLARYAPDGALRWAKRWGTPANKEERLFEVAAGEDGSVFAAGRVGAGAVFGEGEPNETTLPTDGGFVAKLAPEGALEWLTPLAQGSVGPVLPEGPSDLALASDGGVLVTGSFEGTDTFGVAGAATTLVSSGDTDIFVAKLDSASGSVVWVRQAGTANPDEYDGNFDRGMGIAGLEDNTVLVTGTAAAGVATFGVGETGEMRLAVEGEMDPFVARLRADGSLCHASLIRSVDPGFDSDQVGLVLGRDGAPIVSGWIGGTEKLTFHLGDAGDITLTSDDIPGFYDLFLAKFPASAFNCP